MFENPPLSSARQVLPAFSPNHYESLYLDKYVIEWVIMYVSIWVIQ